MGNPAHTATQGVNLRIQGPKHPPIGPNTPPIPRAMPPSTHARTRPTPATNARPALAAHTRTKWPRPRHTFTGEANADNGADNGTTPRDLAALTPRCAAGPYRWSMGNPAHTATQGVNLRIQGPKHPPIGPNTPPIPRAMPPSTHARTRPTPATNARPALAAHTRTKWPRPRHTFTGEANADNGADNGTTPRDLAALTPRCAAGPYRRSMGNPAHTATQGVNLRNQGPKHPPMRRVLPPDVPCLPAGPHARRGRDRQPTGITRRRPHARSGIRH